MSGICAVWRKGNPGQIAPALVSMTRALSLTGTERIEQEAARDAGVAVTAVFASQQFHSNERVLVACDAQLWNEADLRELAGAPRDSGTAVLLAALYERLGCRFVEKLNGNFSIVLWDRRERKMFAAVDEFGVNRLVYFQNGKELLVASRIDALLHAGIAGEINPRGIAHFMNFGVNLAPETIFKNVHRLAPGKFLLATEENTRIEPYWDMRYGADSNDNEKALGRRLESLVEKAVALRYQDDPPESAGAFLSGGTDSSTVVGLMSRLRQTPAKAFSIGFQDERFNELEYAELAARKFHAEHHTHLVSADDCFEALPRMVRFFDEPFANSSAIPTYFCARLAAEHGVKALLAGDGGDELFGGNERYRTDKIFYAYQRAPRVIRKGIIEPLLNAAPFRNGLVGKARSYVRRSNLPGAERFYSYNFLCAHPVEEVFEPDFVADLDGYPVLEIPQNYYRTAPAKDHLDRLLYLDVKITLGDSDLPKVTQMAELAGIQTRYPFLDRSVAEFSASLPPRLKVRGLQKRYLFKQAFRNLLPPEIIRKKKHGFGIPVASWLKTDRRLREFSRDALFSARALQRGYFRREFLDDLIRKHEADDSTYYGDTLWSFLVLELWHRQYVDRPVAGSVPA